MLRALAVGALFVTITPLLVALQSLLALLRLPGQFCISQNYYRFLCMLLRVRIRIAGTPLRNRPVLWVANHVSWLDIVVLGALAPVVFVAKREVADWPLIGLTARAQRTIFVDRTARHRTAGANAEIAARIAENHPVVLFAEGTSSDGNRVLPFRSGLLGALNDALTKIDSARAVFVQPVSICYPQQWGMPLGRPQRPLVAWYGDLDFIPHLREFMRRGVVDAAVNFGDPVAYDAASDRKRVARQCEDTIRRLTVRAQRGS